MTPLLPSNKLEGLEPTQKAGSLTQVPSKFSRGADKQAIDQKMPTTEKQDPALGRSNSTF